MKRTGNKMLYKGIGLMIAFGVWTVLLKLVDVRPVGEAKMETGFATLNCLFHELTGVHMGVYNITDWLGLVPVFVCMVFAGIGFVQLTARKRLACVDADILLLGVYYVLVATAYLVFEAFPVNYRPILINGMREASYPSSTTLMVLCVMPTLFFQCDRRVGNRAIKRIIAVSGCVFTAFMVMGRLISGVHWLTDIVGAVLLGWGLFDLYRATVMIFCDNK